jgi:hypothetical protein
MPGPFHDLSSIVVLAPKRLVELFWNVLGDCFLVKVQFELQILVAVTVADMEITIKHPSHEIVRIFAQTDAEFFKDS